MAQIPPHQANDQAPSSAFSAPDTGGEQILALYAHREHFNKIGAKSRPEADIRLRHSRARAIRAPFFESHLLEKEDAYDAFMAEVGLKKIDPHNEEIVERFYDIMNEMDEALQRVSRIYEEDCRAAQGPIPNQYILDNTLRSCDPGQGLRAPNGRLLSLYGSRGESVPAACMSVRACPTDLLRHIILLRLLRPVNSYIYVPCRNAVDRVLRRDPRPGPSGFSDATLNIMVTALECMLSVACLAGSVVALSNLSSLRDRIIVTSFFSLAFPYAAVFLSKEARGMFTLNAAYWAVMVVFIVASSYNSMCN